MSKVFISTVAMNCFRNRTNTRPLSSFVKDENSKFKYWETDYHHTNKQKDSQKSYEDIYRTSYQDYASKELEKENGFQLSHVDDRGRANMVDVGQKNITQRSAKAIASIELGPEAYKLVAENGVKKGDVLSVAQIAGIMGAKRTSDLIPLCHPIGLTKVDVRCKLSEDSTFRILIECEAKCVSRTGVEMEALAGATVAALTIYDMCKAVNKQMVITNIKLVKKTGGKSDFDISNSETDQIAKIQK